ncbi:MAG: hypothetical protein DHS20C17_26440 [Cyclobacteriaceae bacterium]|nr:MAG: hypothetical protein DHS20C17_26440 [Cyclobacteriaceae bacterium]
MLHHQKKGKHWYQVDPQLKERVLQRIREEGPLYARDFETPKSNSSEMWGWKPAKQALHELFITGRVAVASRDGFQRLYDLPERVYPGLHSQHQDRTQYHANEHAHTPHAHSHSHSISDYIWHLCQQAIQAHGLVTIPEIRYQRDISAGQIESLLKKQESAGKVICLKVEGSERTFWSSPELIEQTPVKVYNQLHFLSPFDNAVIQRKRVSELFDFDYQTEIYYPANKRKYGYFSLPILYGTHFIGRMDPKAFRDKKVLVIRNLVIEPSIKLEDRLIYQLKSKLQAFAEFNQCDKYEITKTTPGVLKSALS